jgi:SNF2 family DNA or RNA helicase
MMVIDECHNFNELKAARTHTLMEISKALNPSYTLLMSGTPIKALAIETLPAFRLVDPFFDDRAMASFKLIYKGNNTKAVEILQNRLGLISAKIEKNELKLADPIVEYQDVVLPNGNEFTLASIKIEMKKFLLERKAYYEGRHEEDLKTFNLCLAHHSSTLKDNGQQKDFKRYNEALATVRANKFIWNVIEDVKYCNVYEKNKLIPSLDKASAIAFKDVRVLIKYPHLKIQGECLGRVLGGARERCYKAMVHQIDLSKIIESTEKKTVIFTSYIGVANEIVSLLSKRYSPVGVYGDHVKNLNAIVKTFDENEAINPLIATYASLSTAVPLVMADTVILINQADRPHTETQAIGRVHRLGNTGNTYVYKFRLDTGTEPNVVSRTHDIITWARDQVAEITGVKIPEELLNDAVSLEDYGTIDNTPMPYLSW